MNIKRAAMNAAIDTYLEHELRELRKAGEVAIKKANEIMDVVQSTGEVIVQKSKQISDDPTPEEVAVLADIQRELEALREVVDQIPEEGAVYFRKIARPAPPRNPAFRGIWDRYEEVLEALRRKGIIVR